MRASLALICLLSLMPAVHAFAQATAAEKAAAEALFDRGLGLLRDGKLNEACESLEQSQAIEAGIGTMLYLAECYERQGRTASAWALFREASSQAQAAGQGERAETGRKRAERLMHELAMLTLVAPTWPPELHAVITRNGSNVPQSTLGVAVPVDPGEQRVEVKAAGYAPFSASIRVEPRASRSLTLPMLTALSGAAAVASEQSAANPEASPIPKARAAADPRARWQRISGLAVGGAGVAGLLVGGAFGIRAIVKSNDADALCKNGECAPTANLQRAQTAHDQANHAARVSNGTFITGAVLAVAGAALYFTAGMGHTDQRSALRKPRLDVAVSTLPRGAQMNIGGVF